MLEYSCLMCLHSQPDYVIFHVPFNVDINSFFVIPYLHPFELFAYMHEQRAWPLYLSMDVQVLSQRAKSFKDSISLYVVSYVINWELRSFIDSGRTRVGINKTCEWNIALTIYTSELEMKITEFWMINKTIQFVLRNSNVTKANGLNFRWIRIRLTKNCLQFHSSIYCIEHWKGFFAFDTLNIFMLFPSVRSPTACSCFL